ncbi:MAG: hypothetical protein ABSF98_02940 [Bryobacteraceae bacterium]|jgi:hypothetical protein
MPISPGALGTLNQSDLNLWEFIVLAGLGLGAWYRGRFLTSPATKRLGPFHPLGCFRLRRAWQGAVFTGLVTILLRVALLPVLPIPDVAAHDEFSFLLQADTFAHGRLTNPTHPMWQHFESIHILQRPTYQSMYPPMQGMILAAGQLAGEPWVGVLLATGLMCGGLTWMLYGYLPPEWALLGGILGVLRFGVFSYWMNGYWGGAAAALGGALLLGVLPCRRRRYVWLGCLGLAILANSRPYEGMMLAAGAAIVLGWERARRLPLQKHPAQRRFSGWRLMAPGLLVLLAAGGCMAIYFRAVTGSAFRIPYDINRATYGWPMTQAWMTPAITPAALRHRSMRDYYMWEEHYHDQFRRPSLFAKELSKRFRKLWSFYIGPLLSLPLLLFGRRAFRSPRLQLLLLPGGLVLAGVLAGQTEMPHYLAPITGVILAFMVQAMRHLWVWRRENHTGARLGVAILTVLILLLAGRATGRLPMRVSPFSWCCVQQTNNSTPIRAAVRAELARMPGLQLVIVRYGPDHSFFEEWVYNAADIDAAKVVWARELTEPENRKLLAYFHNRTALLVEPDSHPPRLRPYQPPVACRQSSHRDTQIP